MEKGISTRPLRNSSTITEHNREIPSLLWYSYYANHRTIHQRLWFPGDRCVPGAHSPFPDRTEDASERGRLHLGRWETIPPRLVCFHLSSMTHLSASWASSLKNQHSSHGWLCTKYPSVLQSHRSTFTLCRQVILITISPSTCTFSQFGEGTDSDICLKLLTFLGSVPSLSLQQEDGTPGKSGVGP